MSDGRLSRIGGSNRHRGETGIHFPIRSPFEDLQMLGRSIFASCAALRLARLVDDESSRPDAIPPTPPTPSPEYRRVVIRQGVPHLVPRVMAEAVNQK